MDTKEKMYQHNLKKNLYFVTRLQQFGIERKYMGFYYLIDILELIINQNFEVKSFSIEVYPLVAARYNKSAWTVERDIRNSIDKVWKNGFSVELKKFYFKLSKPSCCEFIYLLKTYILAEIG